MTGKEAKATLAKRVVDAESDVTGFVIRVERFHPVNEIDGPADLRNGSPRQLPAVALKFAFNEGIIAILKAAARGRSRGWSPASGCWWVLSDCWPEVRRKLLDKGVKLTGPLAHPRKLPWNRSKTIEKWDARKCKWR